MTALRNKSNDDQNDVECETGIEEGGSEGKGDDSNECSGDEVE